MRASFLVKSLSVVVLSAGLNQKFTTGSISAFPCVRIWVELSLSVRVQRRWQWGDAPCVLVSRRIDWCQVVSSLNILLWSTPLENHVTHRSHPELDWSKKPQAIYVAVEVVKSDAFRSLSKIESEILLFIYSKRRYPSFGKTKKKREEVDYWKPANEADIKIPYKAVIDFLSKGSVAPPVESTITRAIRKLMKVGFISLTYLGGNGKGDLSKYRIAHNWRLWKKGDPPCFEKAGMERGKGFCLPGSGEFYPDRKKKGGQARMSNNMQVRMGTAPQKL